MAQKGGGLGDLEKVPAAAFFFVQGPLEIKGTKTRGQQKEANHALFTWGFVSTNHC